MTRLAFAALLVLSGFASPTIAGTTGKLAFLVWIISMIMGFLQSFTYAEIAGMFGNKSGGASVYGATAWLRYSKFIAPLSVWCNWFAWSPVLSLGCAIAAGYILNSLFPIPAADSQMVIDWVTANASALTAESPRVVEWLGANATVPLLGWKAVVQEPADEALRPLRHLQRQSKIWLAMISSSASPSSSLSSAALGPSGRRTATTLTGGLLILAPE